MEVTGLCIDVQAALRALRRRGLNELRTVEDIESGSVCGRGPDRGAPLKCVRSAVRDRCSSNRSGCRAVTHGSLQDGPAGKQCDIQRRRHRVERQVLFRVVPQSLDEQLSVGIGILQPDDRVVTACICLHGRRRSPGIHVNRGAHDRLPRVAVRYGALQQHLVRGHKIEVNHSWEW